jgi:hypothetical protein
MVEFAKSGDMPSVVLVVRFLWQLGCRVLLCFGHDGHGGLLVNGLYVATLCFVTLFVAQSHAIV